MKVLKKQAYKALEDTMAEHQWQRKLRPIFRKSFKFYLEKARKNV